MQQLRLPTMVLDGSLSASLGATTVRLGRRSARRRRQRQSMRSLSAREQRLAYRLHSVIRRIQRRLTYHLLAQRQSTITAVERLTGLLVRPYRLPLTGNTGMYLATLSMPRRRRLEMQRAVTSISIATRWTLERGLTF